jgi:hypothetical protein
VKRLAAVLAGAAAALAACGTPSADLFVVERSGELPDAELKLLVSDGGTVRCNGGEEREMGAERLLEARTLARDLAPLLDRGLDLEPAPGVQSQLRYRVLGGEGEASFADTSPDLPRALADVQRFTRAVARESCGLDR